MSQPYLYLAYDRATGYTSPRARKRRAPARRDSTSTRAEIRAVIEELMSNRRHRSAHFRAPLQGELSC